MIGRTTRNAVEVGYGGYIYQIKQKANYGYQMRCKDRSCKVTARCDLTFTTITVNGNDHCHPPCDYIIIIRQFLANLKNKCDKNFDSLERVYNEEIIEFQGKFPQFTCFLPTYQ